MSSGSIHCYQLDFVTPGSFPSEASSRKQIRQTPNFRMYERLRPHCRQRLTALTSNFGGLFALTIHDFFAIPVLQLSVRSSQMAVCRTIRFSLLTVYCHLPTHYASVFAKGIPNSARSRRP